MMNSQILHIILETDGVAKQTRAKIKRGLVPSFEEDGQDGARPSDTSNEFTDLNTIISRSGISILECHGFP
jgi:hypothetical protein